MKLSAPLSIDNPLIPDDQLWVTPVFGILYLTLIIIALALLVTSKGIPALMMAAIAVAVLTLPFIGAIAWIAYSMRRQHNRTRL
ncbi:hypothetical protein AB6813_22055 [bacterium RCC_150]